jgi:uncharacterized protein DUF1579
MNGRQRVAALWAVCAAFSAPSWAQAPAATPAPKATPTPAASAPAPVATAPAHAAGAPAPDAPASGEAARPAGGLGPLRGLVGSWDVAATVSVKGQPPLKFAGTCENAWVMGGHALDSVYTFTPGAGGAAVDGRTTYGYDRDRQEFFAITVNTSAYPYGSLHGPYYDGSRSFVLRSEATSDRGLRVKRREVIRMEGDDRHVIEVYVEVPGVLPAKVLEAVFTRR